MKPEIALKNFPLVAKKWFGKFGIAAPDPLVTSLAALLVRAYTRGCDDARDACGVMLAEESARQAEAGLVDEARILSREAQRMRASARFNRVAEGEVDGN